MGNTHFTKDHEYVRVEGDVATFGITDYAQSQLGDVVFVEVPKVGAHLKQGAEAAVVEKRESGERSLCAGLRRSDRGKCSTRRHTRHGQRRSGRQRLVRQNQTLEQKRARRVDE